jgi:hypothetical protein
MATGQAASGSERQGAKTDRYGSRKTAARKDTMHSMNTGAARHLAIAPRNRPADFKSTARHEPASALLSPMVLRRLVAAMVD